MTYYCIWSAPCPTSFPSSQQTSTRLQDNTPLPGSLFVVQVVHVIATNLFILPSQYSRCRTHTTWKQLYLLGAAQQWFGLILVAFNVLVRIQFVQILLLLTADFYLLEFPPLGKVLAAQTSQLCVDWIQSTGSRFTLPTAKAIETWHLDESTTQLYTPQDRSSVSRSFLSRYLLLSLLIFALPPSL